MDEGLKKRLIGAVVLASLAVIFVPMLFEAPPPSMPQLPPLPAQPPFNDFASELLRDEIPAVTPLAPPASPQPALAMPPREPVDAVASPQARDGSPPATDVARNERPLTGLSAWVVQAASLSSEENANRLVARLREAGLPTPDPEIVELRGKRYYRVRVGPLVERAAAESMLDEVSRISGSPAQVLQYP